jgi:hypothetical protein
VDLFRALACKANRLSLAKLSRFILPLQNPKFGPELINVCLDFDERVMRMGFGSLAAVRMLRDVGIVVNSTSAKPHHGRLRGQSRHRAGMPNRRY